jgi:para-nitrobenzyl esterase
MANDSPSGFQLAPTPTEPVSQWEYDAPLKATFTLAAARDGFHGWTARRMARNQTEIGAPAYLFFFEHHYRAEDALHLDAFHGSELPFGFGLSGSNGTLPKDWPKPPDDHNERMIPEVIMDYFTSFASSGQPVARGQAEWKSYGQGGAFLDIADKPQLLHNILPGTYELQGGVVSRRGVSGTQNWYINVGLASPAVPAVAAPHSRRSSDSAKIQRTV